MSAPRLIVTKGGKRAIVGPTSQIFIGAVVKVAPMTEPVEITGVGKPFIERGVERIYGYFDKSNPGAEMLYIGHLITGETSKAWEITLTFENVAVDCADRRLRGWIPKSVCVDNKCPRWHLDKVVERVLVERLLGGDLSQGMRGWMVSMDTYMPNEATEGGE